MSRILAAVAVVLLALLSSSFPAGGQSPPALSLVREISTGAASPSHPFQAFDTLTMAAVDLRGDGRIELVAPNDNDFVYVLDPQTGHVLSELATWRPGGWHVRDIDSPAVGDVFGTGEMDLAHLNSAAQLTVFRPDAANSTADHLAWREAWNRTVDASRLDPSFAATHPWYSQYNQSPDLGADASPYIARIAGEPTATVTGQSDGGPGIAAYRANGTLRWLNEFGDGDATAWFGQLRANGPWVAVAPNDGGHVFTLDARNGDYVWNFDSTALGANPGSMTVLPLVADFYGDGNKEVFVGARVAVDDGSPGWMSQQHAMYFLLNPDGSVRWQLQPSWGNPLYFMLPVAIDANGDGVKDVVMIDWNTIGHNPGDWNSTGPANLFAINGKDGSVLWHAQLASTWSNKDVAMARFSPSDPAPEIAAETQSGGRDGVGFFALSDGHLVGFTAFPSGGWQATRGPLLADIDGDGTLEMIVPLARSSTGCPYALDVGFREGELAVYKTQAPDASAAWTNDVLYDAALDTPTGYHAAAGAAANVTASTPPPSTTPSGTTPSSTSPSSATPSSSTPTSSTPTSSTPVSSTAASSTPASTTPSSTAPSATTPASATFPSGGATTPTATTVVSASPSESGATPPASATPAKAPGPGVALVAAGAAAAALLLARRRSP